MNEEHKTQVREKASEFGSTIRDSARDMSQEARNKTSQIREKASELGQGLREFGHEATDMAREKLHQIKDSASHYYDESKRKVGEVKESVEHFIQERPIRAVLIACGVGLLMGILVKRSRSY